MKVLLVIVFLMGVVALAAYLVKKAEERNKPDDDNECVDCDKPPEPVVPPVAPVEPVALSVELKPNNPVEVPAGVFCTRTLSIIAEENIGCEQCPVTREWYDNGSLRETGTILLTGYFNTGHTIKYRLVVNGSMVEKEVIIT
jgi:hypothetical protein